MVSPAPSICASFNLEAADAIPILISSTSRLFVLRVVSVPLTVRLPAIVKLPLLVISMLPANVDTPETFTLSRLVCPSTSKSPLASILPTNVVTPDILTLSNSVCPSTSKLPFKSVLPATVAIPVTLRFLVSKSSPGVKTPVSPI